MTFLAIILGVIIFLTILLMVAKNKIIKVLKKYYFKQESIKKNQ